jgi:hypothetical protein
MKSTLQNRELDVKNYFQLFFGSCFEPYAGISREAGKSFSVGLSNSIC